jgi:hypothetical protein
LAGVGLSTAQADSLTTDARQFAVLGPFSNNETNYTNVLGETLRGEAATAINMTTGESISVASDALLTGVCVLDNPLGDHRNAE